MLSQVKGGLDNSQAELLSLVSRAEADLESIYFTARRRSTSGWEFGPSPPSWRLAGATPAN